MARTKQTVKKQNESQRASAAKSRGRERKLASLGGVKKGRQYRVKPGTAALREIRKQQRSVDPLLKKGTFSSLVRELVESDQEWSMCDGRYSGRGMGNTSVNRWNVKALDALREGCQKFLTDTLRDANHLACMNETKNSRQACTLRPQHVEAAFRLKQPDFMEVTTGLGVAHIKAQQRINATIQRERMKKAKRDRERGVIGRSTIKSKTDKSKSKSKKSKKDKSKSKKDKKERKDTEAADKRSEAKQAPAEKPTEATSEDTSAEETAEPVAAPATAVAVEHSESDSDTENETKGADDM